MNKLEPLRKELLARRHKLVEGTASEVTHPQVQQAIARMLRQPDEGALSKLLVEVVLLECTDRAPTSDPDVLIATAKRHRVDVDKLRKAVEQEFTAKRAKLAAKQKKAAKKGPTEDRSVAYCKTTQALGNCPSAVFLFESSFLDRQRERPFLPEGCAAPSPSPGGVPEAKRGAAFCAASTRAAGQGLTGGAERSAIVVGRKDERDRIDRGAAKRSDVPLVLREGRCRARTAPLADSSHCR